jgi:hypothetical protein
MKALNILLNIETQKIKLGNQKLERNVFGRKERYAKIQANLGGL